MRLDHIHSGVHALFTYPVAGLRGNQLDARIGFCCAVYKAAHALRGVIGGQTFDDGDLRGAAGLFIYPIGDLGAAVVLVVAGVRVYIYAFKLGDGVEHDHRNAGFVRLRDGGLQRFQIDAAYRDAGDALGDEVFHHGSLGCVIIFRRRSENTQFIAERIRHGLRAFDAACIERAGHCRGQEAQNGRFFRHCGDAERHHHYENQCQYLLHVLYPPIYFYALWHNKREKRFLFLPL